MNEAAARPGIVTQPMQTHGSNLALSYGDSGSKYMAHSHGDNDQGGEPACDQNVLK